MAVHQTGKNILISYKAETTIGVAVTGASGRTFRKNAGSGLQLTRATINPNEVRSDGKTSMGRLGSKSVTGSEGGDLSLGTFDALLEAGVRGTWATLTAITATSPSTLTSVTTNVSQWIAAGPGGWVSAGFRVGDVFQVTGHSTVANNNRNLRVSAVTTLTLTVMETLVADAVADSVFTMTIAKKLIQSSTPVARSFTFDEWNGDIDASKVSVGCRASSFKVTGQPDGMAMVEFALVGMDQTTVSGASAPSLTSPTLTSSVALTWLDATIRVGATDRVNLTSFEFTHDLSAATMPVIGSSTSPDVFANNAVITGSVASTITDFTSDFTDFVNETEFEFHALLVEPTAEPKNFLSFYFPRLKRTGYTTPHGNDGARIATMAFICGTKGTATGYDDTMLSIQSSAAYGA